MVMGNGYGNGTNGCGCGNDEYGYHNGYGNGNVIKDMATDNAKAKVFADTLDKFGAYAQYCCLPEDHPIALKPQNLSYEEAAVVPVGARTALYFLKRVGLQAGQRILIYGASGSRNDDSSGR